MKNSPFKLLDKHSGLGTYWWIELFDDTVSSTKARRAQSAIKEIIHTFEARYSRFKPNSLLSQLNTDNYLSDAPDEMHHILRRSLEYYFITSGVFNIGTGQVLEASGYDADCSFTASSYQPPVELLPISLRLHGSSVQLMKPVALDFGGIGKGWLIDAIANELQNEFGFEYFLINGGGDMYATSNHEAPIEVVLEHPLTKSSALGSIQLHHQALAASSPFKRVWKHTTTGKLQSHLVDTSTGQSNITKQQVASFTIANTATNADVYATTFSLLGTNEQEHINHIARGQGIEYCLVSRDHSMVSSQKFSTINPISTIKATPVLAYA